MLLVLLIYTRFKIQLFVFCISILPSPLVMRKVWGCGLVTDLRNVHISHGNRSFSFYVDYFTFLYCRLYFTGLDCMTSVLWDRRNCLYFVRTWVRPRFFWWGPCFSEFQYSVLYCTFCISLCPVFYCIFCISLCPVFWWWPMLPVSLCCSFLIALSVFERLFTNMQCFYV